MAYWPREIVPFIVGRDSRNASTFFYREAWGKQRRSFGSICAVLRATPRGGCPPIDTDRRTSVLASGLR